MKELHLKYKLFTHPFLEVAGEAVFQGHQGACLLRWACEEGVGDVAALPAVEEVAMSSVDELLTSLPAGLWKVGRC